MERDGKRWREVGYCRSLSCERKRECVKGGGKYGLNILERGRETKWRGAQWMRESKGEEKNNI